VFLTRPTLGDGRPFADEAARCFHAASSRGELSIHFSRSRRWRSPKRPTTSRPSAAMKRSKQPTKRGKVGLEADLAVLVWTRHTRALALGAGVVLHLSTDALCVSASSRSLCWPRT
jgi:hypothetical protein